jgi:hypothetical protein
MEINDERANLFSASQTMASSVLLPSSIINETIVVGEKEWKGK